MDQVSVLTRPLELPAPTLDLSVIIVNYNTRRELADCLASLEDQGTIVSEDGAAAPRSTTPGGASRQPSATCPRDPDSHQRAAEQKVPFRFEAFVVDNASNDGSAEMVSARFPWVRLIRSPTNGGFASGNNLAIPMALGRYILLLNPDTQLQPGTLYRMVEYMDAHPEAAIAGPKLVRADGSIHLACRRSFPTLEVAFYRMVGLSRLFPRSRRFGRYNLTYLDPDVPTEVDSVTGAFMMVRREAIQQVGLLDERFFMYGEDLDWALRMKQRGWKVLYNPAVTVYHHHGTANRPRSATTVYHFYRSMLLFYFKHDAPKHPFLVNWLVAAGIYGYLLAALAKHFLVSWAYGKTRHSG